MNKTMVLAAVMILHGCASIDHIVINCNGVPRHLSEEETRLCQTLAEHAGLGLSEVVSIVETAFSHKDAGSREISAAYLNGATVPSGDRWTWPVIERLLKAMKVPAEKENCAVIISGKLGPLSGSATMIVLRKTGTWQVIKVAGIQS